MVTGISKRQAKLFESYKKVAEEDVRRVTTAEKCGVMSEPDAATRRWELAEPQRNWAEALEHENMVTYRKHAGTVDAEQDDQDFGLSLSSGTNWCQEGDKFVRLIAQLFRENDYIRFPSWISADLANIVFNHGKHKVPDLSQNALRILLLILEKQPPVSVRAGPLDMAGLSSGTPPPFVLLNPPAELEPWVGLPGGRTLGCEKTSAQAFGKSLRSATSKKTTTLSRPAKYGVRWLCEEVPKWEELLTCLKEQEQSKNTAADVECAWGSVWLVQYLLQAWQVDLETRIQVVESHASNPKQQKQSQQMLTVSYAHRALEDVAAGQAQALFDQCWNMIASMSSATGATGLTEGSAAEELAQAMLAAVQRFLQLVYRLLGVAEDVGLSQTSTAFCPCAMRRQTLDMWLMRACANNRAPAEWRGMLVTLTARDRMRFLSMFLSHRYHLMNFNGTDVNRHGADSFVKPGELFTGSGTDAPATFVDMPPGTTMHVLCTSNMLGRFYKAHSAFQLDGNAMCTFVHHLCEAALQTLPELVGDNRFRVVRHVRGRSCAANGSDGGAASRDITLEPLQATSLCYMSTHVRFDRASALSPASKREGCCAEFVTLQLGVEAVVRFLGKLANLKVEGVETMHYGQYEANAGLQRDMLVHAVAADVITKHSSNLLASTHRSLGRIISAMQVC